jgi:hypothetical protein
MRSRKLDLLPSSGKSGDSIASPVKFTCMKLLCYAVRLLCPPPPNPDFSLFSFSLQSLLLTGLTPSLSCNPYRDQRAKPGNLLTKRFSFSYRKKNVSRFCHDVYFHLFLYCLTSVSPLLLPIFTTFQEQLATCSILYGLKQRSGFSCLLNLRS